MGFIEIMQNHPAGSSPEDANRRSSGDAIEHIALAFQNAAKG